MNRPRGLFTREDIRRQLWGDDTFVDYELGIDYCLSSIRSALHDKPGAPHYVETAPRRGYQFIAPVARVRVAAEPILAVLQFANHDPDPAIDYLVTLAAINRKRRGKSWPLPIAGDSLGLCWQMRHRIARP